MHAYEYSPTATKPADYDEYYHLKRALDDARMRRYSARLIAEGAARRCGPCPFTNEVTAEYAQAKTAYQDARANLTAWLKDRSA